MRAISAVIAGPVCAVVAAAQLVEVGMSLVASGPSLDVNQLVAIESTQHDSLPATAAASPAGERDRGNRRAARLELLPDRLVAQELVAAGPKPRLMDGRDLAPGRGAARLTGERLGGRARTIGRTRRSAAGPAGTRVSPGDSEAERGSAARPLRVHWIHNDPKSATTAVHPVL